MGWGRRTAAGRSQRQVDTYTGGRIHFIVHQKQSQHCAEQLYPNKFSKFNHKFKKIKLASPELTQVCDRNKVRSPSSRYHHSLLAPTGFPHLPEQGSPRHLFKRYKFLSLTGYLLNPESLGAKASCFAHLRIAGPCKSRHVWETQQ